MIYSREDFENDPVHYCVHDLSLNIRKLPGVDLEICGECGNSDFESTDITNWTKLYTEEYGEAFLDSEQDDSDVLNLK